MPNFFLISSFYIDIIDFEAGPRSSQVARKRNSCGKIFKFFWNQGKTSCFHQNTPLQKYWQQNIILAQKKIYVSKEMFLNVKINQRLGY